MKTTIPALSLSLIALLSSRASADEPLTFEQHVRPILKAYCLDCHGAGEKLKGGLDLRLKRLAEKGGKSGTVLVVGDPGKSLLVQRMKSGEMPTTQKKVPAEMIAVVEQWIASGALARRTEPMTLPLGIDITPEERAYWFYLPLKRVEPAKFASSDRVRTPIDAFVLMKLREKTLSLQDDADRLTLIRRVSLDLLGLPPSQTEIDAFLTDTAPDAYEKLLDRLLASPHYGERWARHWLDVVGYADSNGDGVADTPRPYAWKYRDYVIRSLNADKPLDQFVIEQLAGDELAPPLLGLTVGCAQCHDHRYDPIPQADYFRLRAILEPAFNPATSRRS